ncbi:MAG: EF-P lysine aminoacylase GenX [SAR324 cluster bacterium]|nr:EF-P lysine aminoacylase GenX [SAR324 cluster bacterium]
MTFQSRKTPYRTHNFKQAGLLKVLAPGKYAGRVFDTKISGNTLQICIFLEEAYYEFYSDKIEKVQCGELLVFEVDADGKFTPIESLYASRAPLKANGDVLRWRKPGQPISRMQRLRQRHHILQKIRAHLDQHDFLEVDTPVLVKAPSPESQFTPFSTKSNFLITSPEFQMKRLLVGGFEKIYQLTPCFRDREISNSHNPEFTMLEWYRAYDSLETIAEDLQQLVTEAAKVIPQIENGCLHTGSSQIQLYRVGKGFSWKRCSVAELFEQHLNLDIEQATSAEILREIAVSKGYGAEVENLPICYEQIFFRLWHRFEAQLGQDVPVLIYDWPAPLASLAQIRKDKPTVAERVELYVAGMELANGFGELTDPIEQRMRFKKNLSERQRNKQPVVPLDNAFLEGLEQGMPPSAGMALGLDRLVMLLTGASHIRDVLCFSYDER